MSRTPDVDGNVIGGVYNLKSRSPFGRDGRFYAVANVFLGTSDFTDVPGVSYGRSSDDGMSYRVDGAPALTFGSRSIGASSWPAHKSLQSAANGERIRCRSGANAGAPISIGTGAGVISGFAAFTNFQFILPRPMPTAMETLGMSCASGWKYYPGGPNQRSDAHSFFLQEDNELRYGQQFRATRVNYVAFNDYPVEKPPGLSRQVGFHMEAEADARVI